MYSSLEELCCEAEEKNCALWELVLQDDMQQRGVSRRDSFAATKALYLTMKKADEDYEQELLSHSRLVGGDGEKLARARREGWLYCGDFIGHVMETAVKMGESNACMKKIVAAPTAGSCGVMPAVLLNLQREKGFTDDRMTEAMFVRPADVRRRSAPPLPWRQEQRLTWQAVMPEGSQRQRPWH